MVVDWLRLELPSDVPLPPAPPPPDGVDLTTMADLGDTDELRRRVYELNKVCALDIPDRDEFFTYDDFVRERFGGPGYRADGVVLAVDGDDELVGMCAISHVPDRTWAFIEMTGVLRAYRRQGLATAMKVEALHRARSWGVAFVRTIHHPDNVAIIAANRTVGFLPAGGEAAGARRRGRQLSVDDGRKPRSW